MPVLWSIPIFTACAPISSKIIAICFLTISAGMGIIFFTFLVFLIRDLNSNKGDTNLIYAFKNWGFNNAKNIFLILIIYNNFSKSLIVADIEKLFVKHFKAFFSNLFESIPNLFPCNIPIC